MSRYRNELKVRKFIKKFLKKFLRKELRRNKRLNYIIALDSHKVINF